MIKLDIINEVVNKTGITKTKAELAVETVFESMKKSLSKGDRIELRGFGVFNVRPRKTGIGRNPRTGAEVSIPPGQGRPLQARQRIAVHRLICTHSAVVPPAIRCGRPRPHFRRRGVSENRSQARIPMSEPVPSLPTSTTEYYLARPGVGDSSA